MPRIQRKPEEVDAIREKILQQALELMNRVGYQEFSMRMLAREIGVSSPTLYSYFQGKDYLYLCLLTRGFSRLYETMLAACRDLKDSMEQMAAIANAYIDFGLDSSNFYNLMFTWHVPKYNDYIGSPLEPAARLELETAMKVVNLALGTIMTCAGKGYLLHDRDARFILLSVWSTLHGYVAGLNNTLLNYMHENPVSVRQEFQRILHEILVREVEARKVKNTRSSKPGRWQGRNVSLKKVRRQTAE